MVAIAITTITDYSPNAVSERSQCPLAPLPRIANCSSSAPDLGLALVRLRADPPKLPPLTKAPLPHRSGQSPCPHRLRHGHALFIVPS